MTTTLTWDTATEWDSATGEEGVVHESVTNSDHNDSTIVKQGYSVDAPYKSASLVGYWPLQEDTGTTAYDFAGTNNGTVSGATQGATGVLGTSAYSFDGTDDYVALGNITAFDLLADYSWTLAAWIVPNSSGSIISQVATDFTYEGWDFGYENSKLTVHLRDDDTGASYKRKTPDFTPDGARHLVVCTRNGDFNEDISLYEDGVEATNYDTWNETISKGDVSGDTRIGARKGEGQFINATIGPVWYWNTAFTAAEVSDFYDVVSAQGDLLTAKKKV